MAGDGAVILRRRDVVRSTPEDEAHPAGGVQFQADGGSAAIEGRLTDVLGDAVRDGHAAAHEQFAAAEADFLGVGAVDRETSVGGGVRSRRGEIEATVVEPERGGLVDVDLGRPGAGLFEDGAATLEVEPVIGRFDGDGVDVADAQDARAVLTERVELRDAGIGGESHAVDDDQARGVDIDAEGAGGGGVGDTAGDPERATGAGADGGVEGEGDRTGVGVVAAEARELAGEVGAAEEHVVSTLEGERVRDVDVIEEFDARAAPVVRRGGDRAAAGRVVVAEAQDASREGDRAGPTGVVRGDGQGAGVALAERTIGVAVEIERRGEGQDLVADDFEGVVRLVEDEAAAGREGIRRAEADTEEAVGVERDAVAGGAQGGVGVGGEHAAQDVDGLPCPAERIDGAEFEGTRAGLDQAEVGDAVVDDAGQDEARVLEPIGSRADREVRRSAHGGRAGDLEAVAREIRHAHDVTGDVHRALLDDLIARERTAAGAIDGDRGVTGDRDVAPDGELLKGAAFVAVRGDRKAAGDEDGPGVVADVDRTETRLVDDVGTDRRRGVRQIDREQRVQDVDVPDGRQGGDAVDRERGGRVRGRREERVALEGDGVTDRPRARGDEAGVGRHGEAAGAEGTGRDRSAERIAVTADGETARGDAHAAREGAGAGELEHAVAGLDDAAVLDDRDDVQRRLQRGERDAVGDMRTDDERRRRLGGEIEVAVGERGNGARIDAGDGQPARKRGGAGQVEGRAAAVVADGDGSERVGLVGQREGRAAADREGLRRDDAEQGLVERRLDEFKAARSERRGGTEIDGASVEDGATGVSVDAVEVEDARAAVAGADDQADRLGTVISKDRIEISGAIGAAVTQDVEIQVAASETAGDRSVLEGIGPVIAFEAGNQAAAREGQLKAAEIDGTATTGRKVEGIDRNILEEGDGCRVADDDVVRRKRTRQEAFARVAADAADAEASHAGHRVIGRKGTVHHSPRTDDAIGQRRGGVDLDADCVRLAEAAEVIEAQGRRRTHWAGQASEQDIRGSHAPAAVVEIDLVEALDEGHGTEALGDIGRHSTVQEDFGGAEGDRSRIAEAISDVIQRAGVINRAEASAGDVEGGRAEDATRVQEVQVTDD